MEIKIAVAYHKKSPILPNPIYLPIHVGKSLHPEIDLGIQGDNEGDCISNENMYYCELTAIYWLWKNIKADVKGLFHYRRILCPIKPYSLRLRKYKALLHKVDFIPLIPCKEKDFISLSNQLAENLPNLLKKYEIIATIPAILPPSIYSFFSIIGSDYLMILKSAVKLRHPEYYSVIEELLSRKKMCFGNMIVMKNSIFEEYCDFLFSTLEEVKRILITDGYLMNLKKEKIFLRKLGYLAEILSGVFIYSRLTKVNIKFLPVAFLKD